MKKYVNTNTGASYRIEATDISGSKYQVEVFYERNGLTAKAVKDMPILSRTVDAKSAENACDKGMRLYAEYLQEILDRRLFSQSLGE